MAIFVKNEELRALKASAENYQVIVNGILAKNEGITQEDITPQMIIDAFNESADNQDLSGQLSAAQKRIKELEGLNTSLQDQVSALQDSPAKDPEAISSADEIDAKEQTLIDFANKNADNPGAIINEAINDGFLPKNYLF